MKSIRQDNNIAFTEGWMKKGNQTEEDETQEKSREQSSFTNGRG